DPREAADAHAERARGTERRIASDRCDADARLCDLDGLPDRVAEVQLGRRHVALAQCHHALRARRHRRCCGCECNHGAEQSDASASTKHARDSRAQVDHGVMLDAATAHHASTSSTGVEPRVIDPRSHASSPDARSRWITLSASDAATTAIIPYPMFSVWNISMSEMPPCSCTARNSAGGVQLPRSTRACNPSGTTRSRFPGMPPPVMWARA